MDDAKGSSKIDSTQNGMFPRPDFHRKFDQYLISLTQTTVTRPLYLTSIFMGTMAEFSIPTVCLTNF